MDLTRFLLVFVTLFLKGVYTSPTATIDSGVVVGKVTSIPSASAKVNQFLGIPFAAPPVNNLRFAPPVKAKNWPKPLDTTKNAPACLQDFALPAAIQQFENDLFNSPPPPAGESEDCLYLNVWAPATPGANKTVMFWIYGGALMFGTNSLEGYDGSSFAANEDVIIVAANYRTNVFGFTMSVDLPLKERNLGFLDQRLALDWVQRNIHAFGGSPEKVTIFGESAGGISVDALLTSTPHNPPFRAAIMESGAVAPYVSQANTTSWDRLMQLLGCKGTSNEILACARAAKATDIKAIIEKTGAKWSNSIDNVTLVSDPYLARLEGKIAKVPIMVGTNANEGRPFLYPQLFHQTNLTAGLTSLVAGAGLPTSVLPALLKYVPEMYAIGSPPGIKTVFDQLSQVYTDFVFDCPISIIGNYSKTGKGEFPTWRYYFNATFPNTQYAAYPDLGVYHSSEIPLVFGTYPTENATKTEVRLSRYMQHAWASFAKNPTGGPGWPQFPNVGVLGTPGMLLQVDVASSVIDRRCKLFDPFYAQLIAGSREMLRDER